MIRHFSDNLMVMWLSVGQWNAGGNDNLSRPSPYTLPSMILYFFLYQLPEEGGLPGKKWSCEMEEVWVPMSPTGGEPIRNTRWTTS